MIKAENANKLLPIDKNKKTTMTQFIKQFEKLSKQGTKMFQQCEKTS